MVTPKLSAMTSIIARVSRRMARISRRASIIRSLDAIVRSGCGSLSHSAPPLPISSVAVIAPRAFRLIVVARHLDGEARVFGEAQQDDCGFRVLRRCFPRRPALSYPVGLPIASAGLNFALHRLPFHSAGLPFASAGLQCCQAARDSQRQCRAFRAASWNSCQGDSGYWSASCAASQYRFPRDFAGSRWCPMPCRHLPVLLAVYGRYADLSNQGSVDYGVENSLPSALCASVVN